MGYEVEWLTFWTRPDTCLPIRLGTLSHPHLSSELPGQVGPSQPGAESVFCSKPDAPTTALVTSGFWLPGLRLGMPSAAELTAECQAVAGDAGRRLGRAGLSPQRLWGCGALCPRPDLPCCWSSHFWGQQPVEPSYCEFPGGSRCADARVGSAVKLRSWPLSPLRPRRPQDPRPRLRV